MCSKDEAVKFFNLMVHNTYEIAPVSLRVSLMEKKAKNVRLLLGKTLPSNHWLETFVTSFVEQLAFNTNKWQWMIQAYVQSKNM